ncbi:UNVERIFIED_CONTAM: hypothetical protein FKN15_038839 [Acipenser sinensis]
MVFDFGSEVYIWHVVFQSPTQSPYESELKSYDAKLLIAPSEGAVRMVLEGLNVQRGHGQIETEDRRLVEIGTVEVDVWHIREFDYIDIPRESVGQFHEGETYVIKWKYTVTSVVGKRQKTDQQSTSGPGKEKVAYFFWQGSQSSVSGKGASALMTVEMGKHQGAQVLVAQGKESPCFLQLFQGGMVTHRGCREQDETSRKDPGKYNFTPRLFRMSGSSGEFIVEEQLSPAWVSNTVMAMPFLQDNLYSTKQPALFLLDNRMEVYLWQGWQPADTEETGSAQIRWDLERKCAMETVLQYCKDPGKYNFTPRLFRMSGSSGEFIVEEQLSPAWVSNTVMAMPFLQDNLYSTKQPALFLLDNRMEVYLWQGWQPADTEETGSAQIRWDLERKCAMETMLQYCKDSTRRTEIRFGLSLLAITTTALPEGVDPLKLEIYLSNEDFQAEAVRNKVILVQDALARLCKTQYSFEELQAKPLPEGVDPLKLEIYLSNEDFQQNITQLYFD